MGKTMGGVRLKLGNEGRWIATPVVIGLALFVIALAAAAYVHLQVQILPEDDAFITYRYVDNLLAGKGIVYNEGQRVMGSSTPLYMFWLAGLEAVFGGDLPTLSVRFNLLWFACAGVALAMLLNRLSGTDWPGWCGAAIFLVTAPMLRTSAGGMESFLFAALVLWSLERLGAERYLQAALLADLALLTRPEGLFAVMICAAGWYLFSRKRFWEFAALLLGPAAVWFGFSTLYFGTPIPQSVLAKSRGAYPLPPGDAIKSILLGFNDHFLPTRSGSSAVRTIVMFLLGAVTVFACLRLSPARRLTLYLVSMLGLLLAFYTVTNPAIFDWYFPILYLLLFAVVFAGGWLGIRALGERVLKGGQPTNRRASTLIATVTLAVLLGWVTTAGYQHYLQSKPPSVLSIFRDSFAIRVPVYQEVALWLNGAAKPTDRVAAPEIGALGYYREGVILDAVGLVSPEALPYLPVPEAERESAWTGVISNEFVKGTNPEYVVTHPLFARKSLLVDDWFRANYTLVKEFRLPRKMWGSDVIMVFVKKS